MRLPREEEQELSSNGFIGQSWLPSVAETDDEAALRLETPLLVGGESYEFAAIANLDLFFTRVYRYWQERGLRSILLAGALNLLALAFTAAFSTFLLLFVDWRALHAECLAPRAGGGGAGGDMCDLAAVALDRRPLLGRGVFADLAAVSYIAVCVVYLGWTAAHYLMDARDMREVAHFMANKLGISESKVVTMTWAEVVHRLVLVQRTTRLCIARDLDELHIVSRIMRKENYLIAMINRNVLRLHLHPPPDAPASLRRPLGCALRLLGSGGAESGGGRGCGGPPMLTKTLEWNLRWCILDHMFDERFRIRPEFSDVAALKRRLRLVAAANLLLSPFLLLFLLAYFFMRNAERLYHHPAALGSRRWSGLAKWRIRELNELPHYLHHRLSASHPAALRYVGQFPSHVLAAVARFMVFVTGSFVALLLLMTFLDDRILERPLIGRQVVWWVGTLTVVLAACRTLVSEEPVAYDPERALADVVSYTHYLPRHWRGRAHTPEVQAAFLSLFRLKVGLFLEELASLATTPLVLAFALPACADSIVEFVSTFTSNVDGVGDVCSLATFDLARHGNTKYGSPLQADKAYRSRQGKLEKSFLTFVATYPTWEPGEVGRRMLAALAANGGGGGSRAGADAAAAESAAAGNGLVPRPAADALPFHQDAPTVFPYQAAAEAGKAADAAAAAASMAAVLTRAASEAHNTLKSVATAPLADDGSGGRGGAVYGGGAGGPPPPVRFPPAIGGGPRLGVRQPQVPLHLQPYHGVRSYTSNASASHLSTAGPGGGWAWRPAAPSSGGATAGGGGLAGGSPPPSVASSQFSNLTAPYLQYYPVPMFYAQQQQLRHVQQHQYRRMYEHLLYGGTPMGVPPAGELPPSPISPYGRRMANSSASIGGGGGSDAGWQHNSMPHVFDIYGSSYMGLYHPYPLHAAAVMPFPPPAHAPLPHLHPHTPAHPHQGTAPPAQVNPASAAVDARGVQRPEGCSRISAHVPAFGVGCGGAGLPSVQSHRRQSDTLGRRPPPTGDTSSPPPPATTKGVLCGGGVQVLVSDTAAAWSAAGAATQPTAGAGVQACSMIGTTEAPDGGWGSGVSGVTDRTCSGSKGHSGTAAAGAGAVASGGGGRGGGGGSATASTLTVDVNAVDSGSATAAGAGYGSDILDMRGVDMAAAAAAAENYGAGVAAGAGRGAATAALENAEVDEDPLGLSGFVKLPPTAAAPPGADLGLGLGLMDEDADGFGLVAGVDRGLAAPHVTGCLMPGTSGQVQPPPRRWSPHGSSLPPSRGVDAAPSSSSGPMGLNGAAPSIADGDGAAGMASGIWYDVDICSHHHPHVSQAQQQQAQLFSKDQARPTHTLKQQQPPSQPQEQQPEHAVRSSSSQMCYSTDYYATGPYYGMDEYALYGGYGEAVAASSGMGFGGIGGGDAAAAVFPGLLSSHAHHLQSQQQQHAAAAAAAAASVAVRASIFGQPADAELVGPPPAAGAQPFAHPQPLPLSQARAQGLEHQAGSATAAPALATAQDHGHGGGGPQLPLNETSELRARLSAGHSLLQSLYESSDVTLQHRLMQQRHARSIHAGTGSAYGSPGGGGVGSSGFGSLGSCTAGTDGENDGRRADSYRDA